MNEQRTARAARTVCAETRAGTTLAEAAKLLMAALLATAAVALAAPGRADAQESVAMDSDGYVPTLYTCFAGGGVGYYGWYNDGYTTSGEITIDSCLMDSLGAGPADYDRVLAHEQGHAQGFGHSDDPNSIMYPYHTFVAAEAPVVEEVAPVVEEPVVEEPAEEGYDAGGASEVEQGSLPQLPATGGAEGATVTVQSGDTLSGIAGETSGDAERWEPLFEANRDRISDPDLIFAGQTLLLPKDDAPEAPRNQEATAEETVDTTQADASQYEQPTFPIVQEDEQQYDAPEASPPEPQADEGPAPAPTSAAPSGSAMSMTVPALGISGVPVVDENSEAALTAGAMHLPGTGFPWEEGANAYIAGHRVGYPGTPSDRIFYDLPSISMGDEVVLTDADGRSYAYAVTEVFAVSPSDTWVTAPVEGRDVVTLQTCTESVDDWTTIGPSLLASGPDSGRLVVRADRVS